MWPGCRLQADRWSLILGFTGARHRPLKIRLSELFNNKMSEEEYTLERKCTHSRVPSIQRITFPSPFVVGNTVCNLNIIFQLLVYRLLLHYFYFTLFTCTIWSVLLCCTVGGACDLRCTLTYLHCSYPHMTIQALKLESCIAAKLYTSKNIYGFNLFQDFTRPWKVRFSMIVGTLL